MQVRRATLGDLATLVRFTSEEAREAEGRPKPSATLERGIRAALENDRYGLYWMLDNEQGKPVGSVSAQTEWSEWHAGQYWWIQSMYILPAYRGTGLMQHLVDAVLEEMRARNGLELRLYVHGENSAAIRAYEKSGFVRSKYRIMTLPRRPR